MEFIKRDRDSIKIRGLMESIKIVSIIKVNYYSFIMVEMKGNGAEGAGMGKKRILPSEISHKFSSKEDFMNFFSKQVGSLSY